MIFPLLYLLRGLLNHGVFAILLHIMLAVTAFLFVLDFSVKKPDFDKLLHK